MQLQSVRRAALAAAVTASSLSLVPSVEAAIVNFDNGNANTLWSDPVNWNPDGPVATNDVVFDAVATAASPTITNTVDATVGVNSVTWTNVGGTTTAHSTEILSGQTLTSAGAAVVWQHSTATTATQTHVNIRGAGSLVVGAGTGSTFNMGSTAAAAAGTVHTLDMTGLNSFTADLAAMNIGTGQRNNGSVLLGNLSSITTTSLTLGGNTTTGGNICNLNVGETNTLRADTINVGNGRTSANFNFRTGLLAPTLLLTNRAGSGGANLNAGLTDINASGGPTSTIDFSLGTITATFGTIQLGRSANSTANGNGTGTLTFGAGTLNATTILLGLGNTGSSTIATGIGVLNMTPGSGTLTATTVVLGNQLNNGNTTRNNQGAGTFNQNGGIAVITTLTLGDRQNTSLTGGNVTGTYNLAAGTLRSQTIQSGSNGSNGTGTFAVRNINWTGGTIQNLNSATDLSINSVAVFPLTVNINGIGTKDFLADPARTITVNTALLAGSGNATKSGTGRLLINSLGNTHSGLLTVNAGTLGGTGSTASDIVVNAGAILAPGASIESFIVGDTSMASGSTYAYETLNASATGADLLHVNGLLTLSGVTLDLSGANLAAGSWVLGDKLTVISYSGTPITSGFTSYIDDTQYLFGANGWTINYNDTSAGTNYPADATGANYITLTLTPVPEPSSLLVLGAAGMLVIKRRR